VAPELGEDVRTPSALANWLRQRAQRKSDRFSGHSIHFERFPPRSISVPSGYSTDYLGNMWPVRFGLDPNPGTYETDIPAINEEYFELLDIFEAAIDAHGSFTMHEWGAGFARWSSVGVLAARACGIRDIKIACVEAEPKHLAFAAENMHRLGLYGDRLRLYPFALAESSRNDLFVIGRASELAGEDPWYGQALNDMGEYVPNGRTYFGVPEVENSLGFRAVEVFVEPPSLVLRDYEYIDLIDMDLQGVEADVVAECIGELNAKVRRLHIGTHNAEVEQRLRDLLHANEWLLIRDLACHERTITTYGEVHCIDGVQSWFNPRFPPADWTRTWLFQE